MRTLVRVLIRWLLTALKFQFRYFKKLYFNLKEKFIMKNYLLFTEGAFNWQMVYCLNDDETENLLENIAKSMLYSGCEKYDNTKHKCVNNIGITNGDNIFIVSEYGVKYIYQLGEMVKDMVGMIVPHLYYVRKVGIFI